MTKIKNIASYQSAHDVIYDYRPDWLDHLTEEQFETLLHLEDFETYQYLVLNDSEVVCYDRISGGVYDHHRSIDSFLGAVWYALTD